MYIAGITYFKTLLAHRQVPVAALG